MPSTVTITVFGKIYDTYVMTLTINTIGLSMIIPLMPLLAIFWNMRGMMIKF